MEEEILEVVCQCDSTKSLGPDGYNFHFIKNNWGVVGEEVVRAITGFHGDRFIP